MAKEMTIFERRCEDCPNRKVKNGVWLCSECFDQKCNEIDDCPEGVTIEEIEKIEKYAEEHKVKNVAKSEHKTERKPKERKPDEEKENLIAETAKFLENLAENVKITNISKIIEFDIGENHYKLDLIRQRKPKK